MKRIGSTVRKGAAVCLDRRHNTLQKLLGISLPRAAAMDEHKEKAEDKFQESPEQHQLLAAKEEPEGSHEEPVDQQQHQAKVDKDGRKAQEAAEEPTVQHQLKQVVETTTEEDLLETTTEEEETSSSPSVVLSVLAHPCSLLQYLLRACAAWCWRLHGAFDDGPNPKPQQAAVAVAPAPPEAEAAPANSSGPGGGGGEKANDVVTRVWAVRRGRPPPGGPRHPREGPGGNGGSHN